MTSFILDRHFVTGIADVDEQHHGLVDLINAFGDHISVGDISTSEPTDIVNRRREYARHGIDQSMGGSSAPSMPGSRPPKRTTMNRMSTQGRCKLL